MSYKMWAKIDLQSFSLFSDPWEWKGLKIICIGEKIKPRHFQQYRPACAIFDSTFFAASGCPRAFRPYGNDTNADDWRQWPALFTFLSGFSGFRFGHILAILDSNTYTCFKVTIVRVLYCTQVTSSKNEQKFNAC